MGHGTGNYDDYPEQLDRSMTANLARLPSLLLVDDLGCAPERKGTQYLPTVAQYVPRSFERYWWDGEYDGDRCHFLGTRESGHNDYYEFLPNGVNFDNLSWSEAVDLCCQSS